MKRILQCGAALTAYALAMAAVAQPTLTSLGGGAAQSVSNNIGGTYYMGGSGLVTTAAVRWTLTGSVLTGSEIAGSGGGGWMSADGTTETLVLLNNSPRIFGKTATGVSPAFSTTPTLVTSATNPAATEFAPGVWNSGVTTRMGAFPIVPSLMVYGTGSSGGSTGTFTSPNGISATGRFVVGQGYISSYSAAAGTTISDNTFTWRPWIWDAQANAGAGGYTILPTPLRTSSNTWKRRTGAAYAVSADGLVIAGAQEHNSSTLAAADPDGARQVVWRWNAGTSSYDMTFLPGGQNGSGLYQTVSMTAGGMAMNQAGTVIVGRLPDSSGNLNIVKWTWDSGSSTWSAPTVLFANSALSTPASWLPLAVTTCAIPVNLGSTIAMSDDASVIVGSATYSTCGSFMSGGFIWHSSDGLVQDWYDYMKAQLTPGVTTGGFYGPTGDAANPSDPSKGLPVLGYPLAISPDGSAITGFQGGTSRIPGAPPWVAVMSGGPTCVAPTITNASGSTTYTRCSTFGVILNVAASGTAPMTYQWYKGASPLSDGPTGFGSSITGSTTVQCRITTPNPATDNGAYHCVVTGCGGATASTIDLNVVNDPAVLPIGDTCSSPIPVVTEGSTAFNICGDYISDGASACTFVAEYADVWFRYTPTFTGNARFQTCGTGWDTTLELLDGCGGAVLACNNDVGTRGIVGTTCTSTKSLISSYAVTTGVPIYVRVSSLTSAPTATGSLSITVAPTAPLNDLCANATPVGLGTFAFNLAEATEDMVIGADVCGATGNTSSMRDVWFQLNSQCGGTYSVDTCGSTITNPMLHVMASCGGGIIACNDNVGTTTGCTSNQARITNFVTTGPVLIRVSASGTSIPASGLGQINITGTPAPCCGNADFDGDGDSGTDFDIQAYFACLGGNCCALCWPAGADFNGDGDSGTDSDIQSFFSVLGGGACVY